MKAKLYIIIVLLINFSSCKETIKEENKMDSCIINLKLDSIQTGEISILPYQKVSSMEDYERLKIKAPINSTLTSITLDTIKVLRTVDISINQKNYRTEIFTGPGVYNLSILNDNIIVENNISYNEFKRLDSLLGYSKFKKIQYSMSLSDSDSIFTANYGANLLKAIKENTKSHPLASMVQKYFWNADLETLHTIVNDFDTSIHHNYGLKQLINRKNNLEKLTLGKSAPQFSLKSFDGDTVSLEDYKGKYVLIDFWAYWCMPCIKGFPELKEIRESYTEDKLAIISISTDQDKPKWIEAVKKHQLPWTQLLEDSTDASGKYAVTAIPYLILISPTGKITYKHDHRDNLTKELKKILE